MVYLVILSVLLIVSAVIILIRKYSQSHSLPGGSLTIRVSLSENRRKSLPARFLRYWYINMKQKEYEISEFPAPAVITLSRCPVRLAKAGFLDRLISLWKLPMELSLTPVPCRFLIKTAAFVIILGGLLNGGSAQVGDSDPGPAPRKEKGSFPPCSWDDFRGRGTNLTPHAVNITECPLSIRLAGKAYAAIDCITSTDVHTFNLTHDSHSNSAGHNNHGNSSHTDTPGEHNNTDHSNSSTTTHTNSPPPIP
ncbi:MAG: hypothetical protein AB2L14_30535 [Candidatus Xenobiia bacterium LiM19]